METLFNWLGRLSCLLLIVYAIFIPVLGIVVNLFLYQPTPSDDAGWEPLQLELLIGLGMMIVLFVFLLASVINFAVQKMSSIRKP